MNASDLEIIRPAAGTQYFFICGLTYDYKLTSTTDNHFPSDDEKWEAGNYFLNARIAKECAEEVQEFARPAQATLRRRRKEALSALVKKGREIANSRSKGDFDADLAIASLVKAYADYDEALKDIAAESNKIDKQVASIIENYFDTENA